MSQRSAASRLNSSSGIRRNLFHHHLSRRPTTSSTSTSASTLQAPSEQDTSDIVARDKNGDYEIGDPLVTPDDIPEEVKDEALEEEST
jgi:hypothetical protein